MNDYYLIGFCGGSGAGKTTLVSQLLTHYDNKAVAIELDSYYKDFQNLTFKEREKINFDHPNSFDIKLLKEHLTLLKSGEKIKKGETKDELAGGIFVLREKATKVRTDESTIDTCGTGGDGKNTFNISTLSSFVTAGAGIKVSKHGNYGVSSECGSSNVLEELGIRFSNDEVFLKNCIDKAGICILM